MIGNVSVNLESLSREDLIARIRELEASSKATAEAAKLANANDGGSSSNGQQSLQAPPPPPPPPPKKKLKRDRGMDFSQYSARRIAIKFCYLGWKYHGLTSQESDTVETVEQHLYNALIRAKLIPDRRSCLMSRCGRTDKGVSSYGQLSALLVRSTLPKGAEGTYEWPSWADVERAKKDLAFRERLPLRCTPALDNNNSHQAGVVQELPYLSILNGMLPADIRVIAWSPVDHSFDARFSCVGRLYRYVFPKMHLDTDIMNIAAQKLLGLNDFRNFCKPDTCNPNPSYFRRIDSARVYPASQGDDVVEVVKQELGGDHPQVVFPTASLLCPPQQQIQQSSSSSNIISKDYFIFEVKGSSFLWHQVRCMMSILFMIGQGLESPSVIDDMINMDIHPKGAGRPEYPMAHELPLVLVDCDFNAVFDWRYGEGGRDCRQKSVARLWDIWNESHTKTILTERMIKYILASGETEGRDLNISDVVLDSGNQPHLPIMGRNRCRGYYGRSSEE